MPRRANAGRKPEYLEKVRTEVVNMSWKYIKDNFQSFTKNKKIDVAVKIVTKSMPTVLEGGEKPLMISL
jgi:septum formation topological specificity factor MinE